MANPLRVGIIGVGGHARQILIPAIEQVPERMRLVALATAQGNVTRAARALGLKNRFVLYRLMKKLGVGDPGEGSEPEFTL